MLPDSILRLIVPASLAIIVALTGSLSCAQTILDDQSPNYDVQWNRLIDQARFEEDSKALPLLQRALQVSKHFNAPDVREAATLRALGKIFANQNQHARASELLEKSVHILRSLNSGSNTFATITSCDLASELVQLNKFAAAKSTLEAALPAVKKLEGSDSANYGIINEALGFLYFKLKDFPRAEKSFLQAARSNKQVGGQSDINGPLYLAGIMSMYRPVRPGDERFLLDIIKINRQLAFPDRPADFVRLGSFYYKTGKAEKAKRALGTAVYLFSHCAPCCGGSRSIGCGNSPCETLDAKLLELFKPQDYCMDLDMNVTVDDPADEKLARKILGELKHPAKCPR